MTDDRFTYREVQILQMTADGLNCKEMAATLNTSEQVVKNIRRNLLDKTDCVNFFQVIATAIRRSVID